jgi:hypothetical protein
VQQSFTVYASSQTITFTPVTTDCPVAIVGSGLTCTAAATASSGLAVAYSSATTSVCTIASGGGTVTLSTTGTCTLDFNQGGNTSYAPAAQVQETITVVTGFCSSTTFCTEVGSGGTVVIWSTLPQDVPAYISK